MENTEKKEVIFPRGLFWDRPKENAPEYIKGNLAINIKELLAFASEQGIEDIIRFTLKKSKEKGTLYFTLNTWKPTKEPVKSEVNMNTGSTKYVDDDGVEKEIPF